MKLPRFLGVEIEVTGAVARPVVSPLNQMRQKWGFGVARDGSLPDGGFEIQTSPANGMHFAWQINGIGEALTVHRAAAGPQAGLHVHVDVRDHKWADLKKLLLYFAKMEGYLFSGIPGERQRGRFCQSVQAIVRDISSINTDTEDGGPAKSTTMNSWYGNPVVMPDRRQSHYDTSRYRALNLHSFGNRQTVEFRLHHGTVDPKVIIPWAKVCTGIVDKAFHTAEKDVQEATKTLTPQELMHNAAGEEAVVWWNSRIEALKRYGSQPQPIQGVI